MSTIDLCDVRGRATSTVTVDVACLGRTFRWVAVPGPGGIGSGRAFSVAGFLYPAGTVPEDGFDPRRAGAVGLWICRGWFVGSATRPAPVALTTHQYVLGPLVGARLRSRDQLVTKGLEGSLDPRQPAMRSVVGGGGRYQGMRGVVVQHANGQNTTRIIPLGDMGAPNLRCEFQLLESHRHESATDHVDGSGVDEEPSP